MAPFSIEELNEIIQGQLTLGTMPPMGGLWAPVGQIVCDSRRVRRGDVFWGLPGSQYDGGDFAEEALIRGAQGTVVAGRHIEPWAGGFSIQVADSARALQQLGQWTRRRFEGTVIGMHLESENASVLALASRVLGRQGRYRAAGHAVPTAANAVLAMLEWNQRHEYAVVETTRANESEMDEISHLCCPHIAAITCTCKSLSATHGDRAAFADMRTRLFEALPTDGVAVVSGDSRWPERMAGQYPFDLLWVGCRPECDLVVEPLPCRDGRLAFLCDGQRFELASFHQQDMASVLAVVGIGKVLGIPARAMRDMLRQPVKQPPQVSAEHENENKNEHEQENNTNTLEVSSSASALREDDATLPPGLERYAC
ncbi:MAG: Mur ligase family protein [Pirellulaceae bacterium]